MGEAYIASKVGGWAGCQTIMFELYGAVHKYVHIVHHSYILYVAAMGVNILTYLPPRLPPLPPRPFIQTNDKRKNYSVFSMF